MSPNLPQPPQGGAKCPVTEAALEMASDSAEVLAELCTQAGCGCQTTAFASGGPKGGPPSVYVCIALGETNAAALKEYVDKLHEPEESAVQMGAAKADLGKPIVLGMMAVAEMLAQKGKPAPGAAKIAPGSPAGQTQKMFVDGAAPVLKVRRRSRLARAWRWLWYGADPMDRVLKGGGGDVSRN